MSLCMELSHLTHIHVFLCSLVLAQWSVSATRSLTLFSDHSGWRQRRSRSQVTTSPLKHHRQQPRLPPWTRSSSRPRCDDHAYESSQATTAEESAAIGIEICTNSNNAPAPPPPTNPAPVLRDLVVARQGAPPSNPDPMPVDPLEEGIAEDQVPLKLPVSEESIAPLAPASSTTTPSPSSEEPPASEEEPPASEEEPPASEEPPP